MSEYKGLEQMRALMKHAKLPKPMSQRSQREFPGNSLQHRAARSLIAKAQEIQTSGDKMLSVVRGTVDVNKKKIQREILGFYNMPDPNSPMNKLIRKMGNVKKTKPKISSNVP